MRYSLNEYHALIESGRLDETLKLELLEGWLVQQPSSSPAHSVTTNLVRRLLETAGIADTFVNLREPITLDASEPEPDLSMIRGTMRDYSSRHPYPADVVLVVEVANTSLKRDSTWKKRVYASAGIAQYWILNLDMRQLEVYTAPQLEAYTVQRVYGELETAEVWLEGRVLTVAIRDLLP